MARISSVSSGRSSFQTKVRTIRTAPISPGADRVKQLAAFIPGLPAVTGCRRRGAPTAPSTYLSCGQRGRPPNPRSTRGRAPRLPLLCEEEWLRPPCPLPLMGHRADAVARGASDASRRTKPLCRASVFHRSTKIETSVCVLVAPARTPQSWSAWASRLGEGLGLSSVPMGRSHHRRRQSLSKTPQPETRWSTARCFPGRTAG